MRASRFGFRAAVLGGVTFAVLVVGTVAGPSASNGTAAPITNVGRAFTADEANPAVFSFGGPLAQCGVPDQNDRSFTYCISYKVPNIGGSFTYTWNCGPNSIYMATQCPTGQDYNFGDWHPNLWYTASYRVCVFLPPDHAYTNAARYYVYYAGAGSPFVRVVDQQNEPTASIGPGLGWVDFGVFPFNAGSAGHVRLGDYTGEGQATRQIGFDAVQFVLGGGPCGSPEAMPDADFDMVPDPYDNCPTVANPDQANTDGNNTALNRPGQDTLGDACDPDISGDGYGNVAKQALGKNLSVYCAIMRADVNADGGVNILDLSAVAGHFLESFPPTPPGAGIDTGVQRLNQDADTSITILDLSRMSASSVYLHNVRECP